MPIEQPRSIPERNVLLQQLLNENGTNAPTATPSPTPIPQSSGLGALIAKLLGLK